MPLCHRALVLSFYSAMHAATNRNFPFLQYFAVIDMHCSGTVSADWTYLKQIFQRKAKDETDTMSRIVSCHNIQAGVFNLYC